MSKLPVVPARDVVRVAEKPGFAFDRQKGSQAVYLRVSDHRRGMARFSRLPAHEEVL